MTYVILEKGERIIMRRRKGRPSIGRKKTYTISDLDNEMFTIFAKEKGKKKSEIVREFIISFNAEILANKIMEMRKK